MTGASGRRRLFFLVFGPCWSVGTRLFLRTCYQAAPKIWTMRSAPCRSLENGQGKTNFLTSPSGKDATKRNRCRFLCRIWSKGTVGSSTARRFLYPHSGRGDYLFPGWREPLLPPTLLFVIRFSGKPPLRTKRRTSMATTVRNGRPPTMKLDHQRLVSLGTKSIPCSLSMRKIPASGWTKMVNRSLRRRA